MCSNPQFKFFGRNELDLSLIDLAGTTPGHIEPQRFSFLFGQIIQAVQKTLDELGALLKRQRQGLFFDGRGVHGLNLTLASAGSNSPDSSNRAPNALAQRWAAQRFVRCNRCCAEPFHQYVHSSCASGTRFSSSR